MTSLSRRSAALASCLLIGMVGLVPAVSAVAAPAATPLASSTPAPNSTTYNTLPTRFSLTISPTRLVVPQTDIAGSHRILVVNRGQSPLSVTVEKRNFTGDPNGALVFQTSAPYSAASWVTVTPSSFQLAPGHSQAVTAKITVPSQPEPGDHQVALVFLVPAGRSSANVRINRGVATPVYITVPGAVDNSAAPESLSAPGFSSGGRVSLTAKVRDAGNVHRDFRGATPLRVDAAGDAAVFPDFTVMRGSTRDVSTTWQPPLMCICHVKVRITNADGTSHTATVRVIVFPVMKASILLAVLLLLALLIFVLRRRYRANVRRAAAALNPSVSRGDA